MISPNSSLLSGTDDPLIQFDGGLDRLLPSVSEATLIAKSILQAQPLLPYAGLGGAA